MSMSRYEINNLDEGIDMECYGPTARVLQNAKNLLMTRKGECCFDRNRGFDPALYDLPDAEMRPRLMPEIDRVLQWEPRCEAVSATMERQKNGEMILRVVVEV